MSKNSFFDMTNDLLAHINSGKFNSYDLIKNGVTVD